MFLCLFFHLDPANMSKWLECNDKKTRGRKGGLTLAEKLSKKPWPLHMIANTLLSSFMDSLPTLAELQVGRSFVMLEVCGDSHIVAEVTLKDIRHDGQIVELDLFVTYSPDTSILQPGDTIMRKICLAEKHIPSWTIACIGLP